MHQCWTALYVFYYHLETVLTRGACYPSIRLGNSTIGSRDSALTSSSAVNPFGKTHGAPEDSERHVGDLGNFKTDGQGNAKGSIEDKQIKLIGEQSVLGVRVDVSSVFELIH
jgi:Cu/Zn superoxide dismutase